LACFTTARETWEIAPHLQTPPSSNICARMERIKALPGFAGMPWA
jgi:hypothetical protein